TPTSVISTLSLHDALPISYRRGFRRSLCLDNQGRVTMVWTKLGLTKQRLRKCQPKRAKKLQRLRLAKRHYFIAGGMLLLAFALRSEEHTSELQSLAYLVCR